MRKALLLSGESDSDKQPMCLQLTSGSGESDFLQKPPERVQRGELELVPAVLNSIISWICEHLLNG